MTTSLSAVTGASGQLGRLAVKGLLARGIAASDIVAVVRDRGRASDLAALGVQLREADYTDPETLVRAGTTASGPRRGERRIRRRARRLGRAGRP